MRLATNAAPEGRQQGQVPPPTVGQAGRTGVCLTEVRAQATPSGRYQAEILMQKIPGGKYSCLALLVHECFSGINFEGANMYVNKCWTVMNVFCVT